MGTATEAKNGFQQTHAQTKKKTTETYRRHGELNQCKYNHLHSIQLSLMHFNLMLLYCELTGEIGVQQLVGLRLHSK